MFDFYRLLEKILCSAKVVILSIYFLYLSLLNVDSAAAQILSNNKISLFSGELKLDSVLKIDNDIEDRLPEYKKDISADITDRKSVV